MAAMYASPPLSATPRASRRHMQRGVGGKGRRRGPYRGGTRANIIAAGSKSGQKGWSFERDCVLVGDSGGEVTVHCSSAQAPGEKQIEVLLEALGDGDGQLTLHWGVVCNDESEWSEPPEEIWPADTIPFGDGKALRTKLRDGRLSISLPEALTHCDDVDREGIASIVGVVVRNDSEWLHDRDGGGDISLKVAAGSSRGTAITKRAAKEEKGNMNLFARYCAVNDVLDVAKQSGEEGAGAILAWLRLSSNRQLAWYKGHNYQGKDMVSMQKTLSQRMTDACCDPELSVLTRHLFRLAMGVMPRGGGGGDDIRMGILNIMRDNGIKEGHRPGIEDPFIAQWHQKLHSSTTRDDIAICEAYLHFLHTGQWDDFWWHLYEYNGLTKDDLLVMKVGWRMDGITGPAVHLPHLIGPFKHFLWILKTTHSGQDLDTAFTMARGSLDGDLQWNIEDLLNQRDEWWVPGKVVEIREKLSGYFQQPGVSRDVILLDIALETFWRNKVEANDFDSLSNDDVCSLLELSLRNAAISGDEKLSSAFALWSRVLSDGSNARWSQEWALIADAALSSVSLALEAFMDAIFVSTQKPATIIGKAANVQEAYLSNFGEEIVRGHPFFVMSNMINILRPGIRKAAGLSSWQIISNGKGPIVGKTLIQQLDTLQGEDFTSSPSVLLSASLGGLEDIPQGVTAVLTMSPVDVLSHIAIRARNMEVLLASCYDAAIWESLQGHADEVVKVEVIQGSGDIQIVPTSELEISAPGQGQHGKDVKLQGVKLEPPKNVTGNSWIVRPEKYDVGVVGEKSRGLSRLVDDVQALSQVRVPPSVALPFGAFERCMAGNSLVKDCYKEAVAMIKDATTPEEVRKALSTVKSIILDLELPSELKSELEEVVKTRELSIDQDAIEADLWQSIKMVWASKWTERAYLSRKACGISDDDLYMAVLLMDLVPAAYAFVLHSVNPTSGNKDEVFGEVVLGLGEALVGNEPGNAMSFTVSKRDGTVNIINLPSKLSAHYVPEDGGVIARSDSNGEDLENFAGAGLYESIPLKPNQFQAVDYSNEPLMWDTTFQNSIAKRLAAVAVSVEDAAGVPQDIEGAFRGDDVYLLQSRAQIIS